MYLPSIFRQTPIDNKRHNPPCHPTYSKPLHKLFRRQILTHIFPKPILLLVFLLPLLLFPNHRLHTLHLQLLAFVLPQKHVLTI